MAFLYGSLGGLRLARQSIQGEIVAVVLAAGASRRLGRPKQLVETGSKTLLEQSLEEVCGSGFKKVILVLGAHREKICSVIDFERILPDVALVTNQDWELGIGPSIACGVEEATNSFGIHFSGIFISAADLPLQNSSVMTQMCQEWHQSEAAYADAILVSRYSDGVEGVPVIFARRYAAELCGLKADRGAKALWQKHSDKVIFFDVPLPYVDVDTEEDIERLKGHLGRIHQDSEPQILPLERL